jgi:prevent-host-death family protein
LIDRVRERGEAITITKRGRVVARLVPAGDEDDRPWTALVELGRLSLSMPLVEWLSLAAHPRTVKVVTITPAIAAGTAALPPTFHRDTADRIIVATCLELDAPLLTHDRRIMRSLL